MPLSPSATHLYCQTCGTAYAKVDANSAYYFRSASFPIGSYTSPKAIWDAGEEMTFCPTDDTGQLGDAYKEPTPGIKESPFFSGSSRMIGETEQDVDTRQAELDQAKGDPDVTHQP